MGRRAVAATFVSVVVFTALLLANSAVYAAQSGALGAAVSSSAQLRERSLASFSTGLSSFDSLASVQDVLQRSPMDCLSPQPYLDSLSGGASFSGEDGGIRSETSSSWSYISSYSGAAGDALLAQFSGYSPGSLDILVSTAVNESFAGGLPSYFREATEVFHFDIPVQQMVSECLSALSQSASVLSGLRSCTQAAVQSALSAEPFQATGRVLASHGRCVVDYSVTIAQSGIAGVSGTFQWSVFGSGSVSTGASPLSGPTAT